MLAAAAEARVSVEDVRAATVSVLDTLGVGDEQQALIDVGHTDARLLTKDERAAVEVALAPADLAWIDQADADEFRKRQLDPSPPEFLVLTLASPRLGAGTATVTATVWCGALCGYGSTYTLAHRQDDTWVVTGTTGATWIS